MDRIKRALHIDFHNMPGIYDFGREIDAVEFAKRLKDAQITYVNIFASCNTGFCYYKTKTGVMYPQMKGDLFGDLVRECHMVGIKVIGYINVSLNAVQAIAHPDWVVKEKDGKTFSTTASPFTRVLCYNSDGYREYVLTILKEILSYGVEGLFLDGMWANMPCYCDKCVHDMKREGYDISKDEDVIKFDYLARVAFAKAVREFVPKDKYLYLNGIGLDGDFKNINTHGEIECLPGGGWGYDYFIPQVSYYRNITEQVLYMTGRFQRSWGDFGGYKEKESIENDFYDALCQNATFSLADHMHPSKNIGKELCEVYGEINKKAKAYEKWTDGTKYISEIGIIRNKNSFDSKGHNGVTIANKGVVRMLSELKYSFDVINDEMDFNRFSLIILPEDTKMTDLLKEKMNLFLKTGKKVISAGAGALLNDKSGFAFEEWSFLEFNDIDESKSPYYYSSVFDKDKSNVELSMYKPGILMTAKDKKDELSSYIKPYFEPHWDGKFWYFYTPPEKKTGNSAVALHNNVCQICFNIFEAYAQYGTVFHKKLLKNIIDKMLPNPLIKTKDLPQSARATLTGTKEYTLLHIKTTFPEQKGEMGVIENHVSLPEGAKVSVRGKYQSVCRLPDENPVEFHFHNGYTTIILPKITGYEMFKLDL